MGKAKWYTIVGRKTIRLSEGAYSRLHALKRDEESFSDVVDRLTGKYALREIVGILDEANEAGFRSARKDVSKRLRAVLSPTPQGARGGGGAGP